MREIEVKAKVRNEQDFLGRLAKLNVQLGKTKKQRDVIFCEPGSKDYEPGSIWLRIRTEDDAKTIFTLKKDNGMRLDSTEHELEVADSKEMEAVVRAMGYEHYCELVKTRQKAKHGDIELCLDKLDGLGSFVEAEKITESSADHQQVLSELWELLGQLGITKEDEVTDSYDVLLRQQTLAASGTIEE